MADEIKNVFISHVHEDDAGLGKLKDLLAKDGMTIRDYSINADKANKAKSPEYIKSLLADKMKGASTLAVYITPKTKSSDWVDWEIEYAHKKEMRIVGIWANGFAGCEMPEALKKYRDALVGWDGGKIIDAINGNFDGSQNPDGSQCTSTEIKRFSC